MSPRGRPKQAVPVQFDPAESVEELAKEIIKQYHPYLATQNIAYLFKNREMTSKGKRILATIKKTSAEIKALFDCDFIITVPYPTYQELTSNQKKAVIDHELTHIEIVEDDATGETKAKLIPHDVDEFEEIIRRHGLYKKDLERLGRVIRKVKKKKKIKKKKIIDDPVDRAVAEYKNNLIDED